MSKFTEYANLPHEAEKLLIGEKYRGLLNHELKKLYIEPLYCPPNPYVDERLSGHVDLSVLHAGGNAVFLAPHLRNSGFSKMLEENGANTIFPQVIMGKNYPNDAQFNMCLIKNTCLYSEKVSSYEIADFLTLRGAKAINIKQGYCRCSICVVDEGSIITSDRGVHSKAIDNDIDCLLITPGYISLDGFDCGFIGGCSFKISDNKICFTGTLDMHPDKQRILDFLASKNVEPVFLTDRPAFDIGTAVPLTEK